MARICHEHLQLEIRYRGWEHGWVVYTIGYSWAGEPIFNDAVMKRQNAYWDARGPGEFHANEHELCSFIPLLDKVIETRESSHVETTDPDVTLAIWPRAAFPFQPSNYRLIYEALEARRRRELSEQRRAEAGGCCRRTR